MNKPMTNNEMKDWEAKTWDRCQKQAWSEAMNREEIIRMAREAGGGTTWWPLHTDTLERFAALVAENEREACAKVCERWGKDVRVETWDMAADDCAAAIRARGEK